MVIKLLLKSINKSFELVCYGNLIANVTSFTVYDHLYLSVSPPL